MINLTVQEEKDLAGGLPTFTAPDAAGVKFPNDGRTVLWINNASVGDITYIVVGARTMPCGFKHDFPETVAGEAADADALTITKTVTFAQARFNDGSGSIVATFSAIVNVSVAAVRQSDAGFGGTN